MPTTLSGPYWPACASSRPGAGSRAPSLRQRRQQTVRAFCRRLSSPAARPAATARRTCASCASTARTASRAIACVSVGPGAVSDGVSSSCAQAGMASSAPASAARKDRRLDMIIFKCKFDNVILMQQHSCTALRAAADDRVGYNTASTMFGRTRARLFPAAPGSPRPASIPQSRATYEPQACRHARRAPQTSTQP